MRSDRCLLCGGTIVRDADGLVCTGCAPLDDRQRAIRFVVDESARRLQMLVEARRCVFFSAKQLRESEGPDSVLCELVEEEMLVATLAQMLGPPPWEQR